MTDKQTIKVMDLQEMYTAEGVYVREAKYRRADGSEEVEENPLRLKLIPSTSRHEPKETIDKYTYADVQDAHFMAVKSILEHEEEEKREELKKEDRVKQECVQLAFKPMSEEKKPTLLVVPSYSLFEGCLDVQGCVEENGIRVIQTIPRCMAVAYSYYDKDMSASRKLEMEYNVVDMGDGGLSINQVMVREQAVSVKSRPPVIEECGYWGIVSRIEKVIENMLVENHRKPTSDNQYWEVYEKAMKYFREGFRDGDNTFVREIRFDDGYGLLAHRAQTEYTKCVSETVRAINENICNRNRNIPLLLCGHLRNSEFGKEVVTKLKDNGWSEEMILMGDEYGIEGAGRIFFGDVELIYQANPFSCVDDQCVYSLRNSAMQLFPGDMKQKVVSYDRIWGSVQIDGDNPDRVDFIIARVKKEALGNQIISDPNPYEKQMKMKIPIITKNIEERSNIMLETFVVNKDIIYFHVTGKEEVYTSLRRFDLRVDFDNMKDEITEVCED